MLESIFLQVLNMSFMASFVIPVVLILRFALKNSPKNVSYALWGIVLFRLVCPFSFESIFSLLPSAHPLPQDILIVNNPTINSGLSFIDQSISLPAPQVGDSINPMQVLIFVGAIIWLIGVILLVIYSVVTYLILQRKVAFALLLKDNIYECERVYSPFVLGIINPKIYLPTSLSEKEKNYILAHEQIHIKRLDTFIKPFAFLTLCVHWFNPLCWLSFVLMSKDMELSCDEAVLKDMGSSIKGDYSMSLLSLSSPQKTLNGSPLAFGESNVKSRIKNVLNYKKPTFWVILMSVIAAIAVGFCLLVNPTEKLDDIKHVGVNAVILEIDYENVTMLVKGLDTNSILGDKCYVTCKDAYIVRIVNSEPVDLNFEKLSVGDSITLDAYAVQESYPTSTYTTRIQLLSSAPFEDFDAIEWAQTLTQEDVASIELIVLPSEEGKRYKKLSSSEFTAAVEIINQSKGELLRYNETLSGTIQTLYVTQKDGKQHTISNGGGQFLIIDGQYYSDNSDLLALWNFKGDSSLPANFYEIPYDNSSTDGTAYTEIGANEVVFSSDGGDKLKLDISLPNGWTMQKNEELYTGYVSPTVNIYNGSTLVGEIFCTSFELYDSGDGGIPYMSVYTGIMMGSGASWDSEYTEISKTKTTATATCKPWHRIDIPGVSGAALANAENRGILSYDAELLKYVGIFLNSQSVTDAQWLEIAKSVKIS